MCGIVGFTGKRPAAPILLDGLSKLEYRGYDSAGLAVRDGEALAEVVKAKGRLTNLVEKTDAGKALKGACGIGHTRWATHGEPSQINAHPHVSGNCSKSGSGAVESEVVGVHNGIIENYTELKEKLLKHGYTFYSQTDTEVVVKLVDYYYKKYSLGPIDAIAKTMVRVRGSYALELMFRDYPGEIWVARKDSPMIIGIADGETYVASDVPAILKYTRNVYYIGNLEFAKLTPGEAHFYDLNGDEIEKQTTEIKWDAEAAEKGGFEHFMMKEIHEQPKAVQDTLNSVIRNGAIDLSNVEINEDEIKNFEQIYIVACGSAWHVGMAAQYVLVKQRIHWQRCGLLRKRVSPRWRLSMWLAAVLPVKQIRCSTHLLVRRSLLLRPRHTAHSLWLCTVWLFSLQKSEERSQTSSMATIFLSCRLFRRRCRRSWKIKNVSSGLLLSMPMPMMYSLWAVVLTMQFVWRAV